MSFADRLALAALIVGLLTLRRLPKEWIDRISIAGAAACAAAWILLEILHPVVPRASIRLLGVVPIPMAQNGAAFPALNIYYDNGGPAVATGVAERAAAVFGPPLSDKDAIAEQDRLLHWSGWDTVMNTHRREALRPGESSQFATIPAIEGTLAEQFRANFDKVETGYTTLQIFVTFKYFEPSGRVGVTEHCLWFSHGFVQHFCGRNRVFVQ